MPWALTMSGPDGALIVVSVVPFRMKPGVVSAAVVYWPTIMPLSLIPKAIAETPSSG